MSVLIETSAGDLVVDLLVDEAPTLCENFLKLCKVKYYHFAPIHSIQKNFTFQTGDPLGPLSAQSDGGSSIWGVVGRDATKRLFPVTFAPKLRHNERGLVSMATVADSRKADDGKERPRFAGSQFLVTLSDDGVEYLDGRAAIFGRVVEGMEVLDKINEAVTDREGNPLVDIRIHHTVILDDPYPDPDGLVEPPASPEPSKAQLATVRIADAAQLHADDDVDEATRERAQRDRDAQAQALTLELMGDLPFAEVKPPENVLFVCKLNPATQDEDLQLIFSRFGQIVSCEVVRDWKTGDSLQYAFIEFEEKAACEAAYAKMQDVLIDDRRIHVDFSQSVSKLSDAWRSDANAKRRQQHGGSGGWGGVDALEKRRQYRAGGRDERAYGMIHDLASSGRDGRRRRERDGATSGEGRNSREGGKVRDRDRNRREGDSRRDRDRRDKSDYDDGHRRSRDVDSDRRDRDRDRHKESDRNRDRSRDRDRSHRDRERSDRDDHRDRDRDRDRRQHRRRSSSRSRSPTRRRDRR